MSLLVCSNTFSYFSQIDEAISKKRERHTVFGLNVLPGPSNLLLLAGNRCDNVHIEVERRNGLCLLKQFFLAGSESLQ